MWRKFKNLRCPSLASGFKRNIEEDEEDKENEDPLQPQQKKNKGSQVTVWTVEDEYEGSYDDR